MIFMPGTIVWLAILAIMLLITIYKSKCITENTIAIYTYGAFFTWAIAAIFTLMLLHNLSTETFEIRSEMELAPMDVNGENTFIIRRNTPEDQIKYEIVTRTTKGELATQTIDSQNTTLVIVEGNHEGTLTIDETWETVKPEKWMKWLMIIGKKDELKHSHNQLIVPKGTIANTPLEGDDH